MIRSRQVRRMVVSGLLMGMVWTSGLWAQDPALKMIPADSLFCVRINGLDQSLGQLDQFLMGVSPINLSMMAKMYLGQALGNPMLAGVKTDGSFAVFAVAPAGEIKDPSVILNGLSILVPVSDYNQFTSSSPKIGKPNNNGISEVENTGLFVANLGNWALLGPSSEGIAATAKSLKAGAAKPLAGALDPGEVTAATQSPLWIYGNIQAIAKALGPGISDKIKQAGEEITKVQSGAGGNMDMKGIFSMYANLADTLLKEGKSVTVTLTPKPAVMALNVTFAGIPGTSIAEMLTKPSPSTTKDWGLLGYCEDGAFVTGASRLDMAYQTKMNLKMMDMFLPMAKVPQDQVAKIKALIQEAPNAVGNEFAVTATASPQSKPFFCIKYVFNIKDKDKFLKLHDQALEIYGKDGFLNKMYADMGLGLALDIKRIPDSTYQGAAIKASRMSFSYKDPNAPEAQALQKIYGDGLDFRVALLDRVAVMTLGANADVHVKKLIDQAKAGGPKQTAAELKSAMDLLPETKTADMVFTVNYLRIMSVMLPAMMPMPMPQPNFQTKSNLVMAGAIDKGKGTLQVALPKEHLTEIMQAVQMMMMQQQQPGGPK